MEDIRYYAHSENDAGKRQTIKEHAIGAAKIMADNSYSETEKKIYYLCGLLHDVGKYNNTFQKYLLSNGAAPRAPHAIWGAGLAALCKFNELSIVINAHHKGLQNLGEWQVEKNTILAEELSKIEKLKDLWLNDLSLPAHILEKLPLPEYANTRTGHELFIRLLFSVLIDADRLDTEAHVDVTKQALRITNPMPYDEFLAKIAAHIDRFDKTGAINILRNAVRAYALARAEGKPGFYALNLPTGMGKTLVSFYWAVLHAKKHGLRRIIIVLPYINIIDQTAVELGKIIGAENIIEHHSSFNEQALPDDEACDRHKLACENWDGQVIITTTVQFFESLFSARPSRCRKVHNIARSVVIFDEVQVLPMELILPTLRMLDDMKRVMQTSFLFCTATLPAFAKRDCFPGLEGITMLTENPQILYNQVKRVSYELFNQLEACDMKDLTLHVAAQKTAALCIFNTKRETLDFFHSIQPDSGWAKVYHLSTNMCPAHRKQVIANIRAELKDSRKILVCSTQLIEAGVDFDFPVVYRALAPLESIIQAAGRCNREGKLSGKGRVYIFNLTAMGMPPGVYRTGAELTRMLTQHDPQRLEQYEFYEDYYAQMTDSYVNPDKYRITQAREKLCFRQVQDSYRIIEAGTRSLLIPDYNQASKDLWERIREKPYLSRQDYRQIQQYSVQVYPRIIMNYAERIDNIKDKQLLIWCGGYDRETGIEFAEPGIDDFIV